MIAAGCWTPYQLLNTINYKLNHVKDIPMDLYIFSEFNGADIIAKRVKDSNIFANVYILDKHNDQEQYHGIKKINIAFDMVFNKHYVDSILIDEVDISKKHYDYIVGSGYLRGYVALCNYFYSKNKNFYNVILEDGVETYINEQMDAAYSNQYHMITKTLHLGINRFNVKEIYVYEPKACMAKFCKNIKQLHKIEKNDHELKNILNNVFDFESQGTYNKKVIYFDENLGELNYIGADIIENNIMDLLNHTIGGDNVIIKMHPRNTNNHYALKTIVDKCPWEIINLNINLTDKILISPLSTAMVTPKMIFDEQPILIFTYKIYGQQLIKKVAGMEKFVRKIKKQYTNSQLVDRVFTPQTMDELDMILRKITKEQKYEA